MENNGLKELFVLVDLDWRQAAICDMGAGWHWMNCAGDVWLKRLYLEQNLTSTDIWEWLDDDVTEHCQEVLNQIGGVEVNDIRIEFNRESHQYQIEVTERNSDVSETDIDF